MEKRDPYNHQQRHEAWLSSLQRSMRIEGLDDRAAHLVIQFIRDFSVGLKVSNKSKKGARSAVRLNNLRQRLVSLLRALKQRGHRDPKKLKAAELHQLFDDMRTGKMPTRDGRPYKSTADYVKVFKTFWHWLMKVDKTLEDITADLDTRREKPKFVYFSDKDFERIAARASPDLKPILALMFDSGMRVTELWNVRVGDFSNDFKELQIRDGAAKTFGRKIKLMLCSKQVTDYIKRTGLGAEDFLMRVSPPMANRELRRLGATELLPEQTRFKNLTLYDLRHSSACYWLPRYKSESALKYRFGWKKSEMIHYYTEYLGMRDTITEDDLYLDVAKAELEKEHAALSRKFSEALRRITALERLQKELAPLSLAIQKGRRSAIAIERDLAEMGKEKAAQFKGKQKSTTRRATFAF